MIAIIAITPKGKKIANQIKKQLPKAQIFLAHKLGRATKEDSLFKQRLKDLVGQLFKEYDQIIFCMALGIVIRIISPYLKDKFTDPAIIVIDEGKRFVISALHHKKADELTFQVANILKALPILTTGRESNKNIIVGIGCRKQEKKEQIVKAVKEALKIKRLELTQVRCLATIDLKETEEGLKEAACELKLPLRFISSHEIKSFAGKYNRSKFVKQKIGIEGVCEPCALLAGIKTKLILPREKISEVMVAIAKENYI
jgi:cobalt-precorrin 5A hydrolase